MSCALTITPRGAVPVLLPLLLASACARAAPHGSNPTRSGVPVTTAPSLTAAPSAPPPAASASGPVPSTPQPSASASSTPYACGAAAPGPAVVFVDPPLSAGTGKHDGPRWELVARALPAVSGDGSSLLVPERDTGLGDVPNLALLEIRIADDARVASTPILSVKEFVSARDSKGPTESEASFAALGFRVCERVRDTNRALTERGFRGLEACTVVDGPWSAVPPCSFRSQALRCGDVVVTYQRPRLSIGAQGGTRHFARPGWAPKPLVEPNWGTIPVRECFSAAYLLASERLFVGELYNACQQGGDWCEVPSVWHAIRW